MLYAGNLTRIKRTSLFLFFLLITFPVWSCVFLEVFLWYVWGALLHKFLPIRYKRPAFEYNKRGLDIVVSITVLILTFPLILGVAVYSRFILGSPVLFKQKRIGLYNTPFLIIKFRSMDQNHSSNNLFLPEEITLSSYGTFIRTYSIDELPSLWNVLKGDMSLVGPRPLVPEFINKNVPQERHLTRPGLTGWAQVNGRNRLTWHEKFFYDLDYVQNKCYALDLKILFLTLTLLCSGKDTQIASKEKFFP